MIFSGGTDILVNSVTIFLSETTFLRGLTFLLRSLTVPFWSFGFFFLLILAFVLQLSSICSVAFRPLENSVLWLSNSKMYVSFYRAAYDYSRANWDGVYNHLRDVSWEDIFKLTTSAAVAEFYECVQWRIANSVLKKVNLLYLLYLIVLRCSPLHLIKLNCFLKTFLRTLILIKLYNISVTPKLVKKVITSLESSKTSGRECIPVVVLKKCEPELYTN